VADLEFDGDVVIVTGAGSGLGRAHALELARRGARVVVNDLGVDQFGNPGSSAAAQATVDTIEQAGGVAVADAHSVADREGGRAIVETALDTWGRVDALVHNAGFSRDNFFEEMTDDQIRAVIDVHLLGSYYVGQPAYAVMKERGGGRMVFTVSAAGLLGAPLMSNYSAAKMGMVGLTRSIALEGAQYGIKANALSPGALTQRADDPDAFRFKNRPQPLDPGRMPAADWLTPERVSPMVAVLCHPSCSVTGEVFMVRAGWFARAWVTASRGWIAGPGDIRAEDVLEHWDDVCGTTSGSEELALDGVDFAQRFMRERIAPLATSGDGS
jgi:NAD(P)-dependent dehydrogenase (short-subunit alcohol dehydrogenase family)